MDEMSLLVEETFRHFHENFNLGSFDDVTVAPTKKNHSFNSFPNGPGVIYHIQKSTSVFVLRTFVSANIRDDYFEILDHPEDYPSLRLIDASDDDLEARLKFFMVDNLSEAEIIHDHLHNRRFPIHEELMCNLSDPGFSWWLTKKHPGFQVSFTLSVSSDGDSIKLGPLGDRELALRKFQDFESLVNSTGINMNIQNETNRVQFTDCEEFILEELKDIFEFGVITDTFRDLFKILAKNTTDTALLEGTWFYIHELAAMRRFWIQVQYDLNPEALS
jgi:hypothetical protein